MSAVLGIILIIVVGPYLVSRIAHARNASWAGPQTTGMRGRAVKAPAPKPGSARKAARSAGSAILHPANGQIRAQAKADAFTAWQQAGATDWLEQRRHERANGTPPPPTGGRTATGASPTLRGRVLGPFARTPASKPGGGGESTGGTPAVPQPANWTTPRTPAAAPPAPRAPRVPVSATPPPQSVSNGGTPVDGPKSYKNGDFGRAAPGTTGGTSVAAGTSTASGAAGAEQFIDGVNQIHATAASGGINAKQAGIKSATEGCIRFSAMLQMLARQMSETGRYGPEITEPLAKAATHLMAAATNLGESDTAITTLKHMQVGELAMSTRQAPHHAELNEAGAR